MRKLLIAPLLLLAFPSSALADKRCGTEKQESEGRVFDIRALRTDCKNSKEVAGTWYFQQEIGQPSDQAFDLEGQPWNCRITRRATGTDPGFYPYTHVACNRGKMRVRFKLRS